MQLPAQVTINDIARMAGVSIATVSRVLNGKPRVSAETKEKILAIANKYNFRPNETARTLATRRSNLIAVLIPDVRNPYFTEILAHIEKLCEEHNYAMVFFNADGESEKERKVVQMMAVRQADGLLMGVVQDNMQTIPFLKSAPFPVVVMSRLIDGLDCVGIKHEEGSVLAADYLLSKRCEEFYYFGFESDVKFPHFRKRLLEHNVREENIVVIGGYKNWYSKTMEHGTVILRDFICSKMKRRNAGLFCASDVLAVNALLTAQECGIKVGSELFIVGFDDTMLCDMVYPRLTSIRQSAKDIADGSFTLLMRRIEEGRTDGEAEHIVFKPKIVIRDT